MLNDDEWIKKADRWIAEKCGVSPDFVNRTRKVICPSMTDTPRTVERNGTTYEMNTSNIGGHKKQEPIIYVPYHCRKRPQIPYETRYNRRHGAQYGRGGYLYPLKIDFFCAADCGGFIFLDFIQINCSINVARKHGKAFV